MTDRTAKVILSLQLVIFAVSNSSIMTVLQLYLYPHSLFRHSLEFSERQFSQYSIVILILFVYFNCCEVCTSYVSQLLYANVY